METMQCAYIHTPRRVALHTVHFTLHGMTGHEFFGLESSHLIMAVAIEI